MDAEAALAARRVLEAFEPSRQELLTTLFEHETPLASRVVREVLGDGDADRLLAVGLAREIDAVFVPLCRIDRVGGLVVASDLRGHRRQRDFVIGPGPASFLLAGAVGTAGRVRALDLGCGSGIQALLLAAAGASVVALDINERALAFARFNAALDGCTTIDVRHGDFLAEESDRDLDGRFDLVVANPPFVLAPRHDLVYRDRPLPGDEVSRRTVERAAGALAPGGRAHVLCNWIDDGREWSAPVRAWVDALEVDAVVTRITDDTPWTYAARWTRDLPPDDRGVATAAWSAALEAEGIGRIHVGLIALRRPPLGGATGGRRVSVVDRLEAERGVPAA